jgi:hypothetical protein
MKERLNSLHFKGEMQGTRHLLLLYGGVNLSGDSVIIRVTMAFPIKVCAICSEEFELKPDKPGFANRCPECSAEEAAGPETKRRMDADQRKSESEANEARRAAMRDLLYRKDS